MSVKNSADELPDYCRYCKAVLCFDPNFKASWQQNIICVACGSNCLVWCHDMQAQEGNGPRYTLFWTQRIIFDFDKLVKAINAMDELRASQLVAFLNNIETEIALKIEPHIKLNGRMNQIFYCEAEEMFRRYVDER